MPVNNRKPPAKMMDEARQCYELQIAGFSTYQIAEKMGFSQKTVRNRIDLHITKRVHPNVDEMRTRQINRLEAYIRSLWEKAMSGDEKAINAAIRTEERIAKLFGTDSATLFTVKAETQFEVPPELAKVLHSIDAKKEADRQEDIERAAQGLPALPKQGVLRARAKELEAVQQMDSEFQERTGVEPPRRELMPWERDATKSKAITPADEFASEPDATDEVPEGFEELGTPIPQPAPKRPRRGKPIPNPAHRFLRDSDD